MAGNNKNVKHKNANARSRSLRAGTIFPVGRLHRLLRKRGYAERVGAAAPVYLAAVLEYLITEIIELASSAAQYHKKKRITPRHVQLGIRTDRELSQLLSSVTIAQGGVSPNIDAMLLPKRKSKKPVEHSLSNQTTDESE